MPLVIPVFCYASSIVLYWFIHKKLMYTKMRVIFDESCLYELDGPDNHDINKLFGIGFGNHMRNSARFGWTCNKDRIVVHAYCHNDGKTESSSMLTCLPNEPVELSLTVSKKEFNFFAQKRSGESSEGSFLRKRSFWDFIAYRLFPYFGGNQTAPHSMKMEIINIE